MPSTSRLGDLRTRLGFLPLCLANLLPLVGVFRFGWDPTTLVVVYALELFVSLPIAGVTALFAGRPPRAGYAETHDGSVISVSNGVAEKRGSVEVVPWLPPIYPRNLPFAAAVGGAAAWVAMVVGVVLADVVPTGDVLARPEVLLSVLALVVGGAAEAVRDHRDGGYRTASPYDVVETPARRAVFVVGVVIVASGVVPAGVDVVLVGVVLAKLVVEWSGYRAARGDGGRLSRWLSGPEPSDGDGSTPAEPPTVPDGAPDARVSTDARAVLWTGVFDAVGRRAPWYWMTFALLWLVLLVVVGGEDPSGAVAAGAGVAVVAAFLGALATAVGTFYVRYAPMEYRRYGDRLVAYDTLVAQPQWATSVDVLRDVEVVPDRLPDRLLGTRTVAVTTGADDGRSERNLGPTADPASLVDAFELPVGTTALEPLDRLPAAVVVGCVAVGVGGGLGLVVGPWASAADVLNGLVVYGTFGIPIAGLALRLVWNRSYPDPDG